MPCYEPPHESDTRNAFEDGRRAGLKESEHNSIPAELLCTLLNKATPALRKVIFHTCNEIEPWWVEHKKRDKEKE